MKSKFIVTILAASAVASMASSASAATLLEDSTPTAPGRTFDYTFQSGAGVGVFDVMTRVLGSVDGTGSGLTDTFIFSLNGLEFFRGSYNFGGGGGNQTFVQLTGSTFSRSQSGRTLNLSSPLTFLEGANTISLNLQATGNDEQFGINSISISGAPGAVPEPTTWALMILGMFMVGGVMRTRRSRQPKVAYSF